MADVNRTVSVEINVKGDFDGKLTKLSGQIKELSDAASSLSKTFSSLGDSLSKISIPSSFVNALDSIKGLKDISIPNVDKLANGISKLSKIDKFPNLGEFAEELKKLSNISLPNVVNVANGLEKLTTASINTGTVATRLRRLRTGLATFSELKLPNVSSIVTALEKLSNVTVNAGGLSSIAQLKQSLDLLSKVKVPNLTKFTNGLKPLYSLDSGKIATINANLSDLYLSLRRLGRLTLPGLQSFVNGLNALVKIKISTVTKKIRQLNTAIRNLSKSGNLSQFAKFASDLANLSSRLGSATSAINSANRATQQFAQSTRNASKEANTFGYRIVNYLQYRAIADTLMAVKQAFYDGLAVIRDYDQALKDLQAITGATDLEVAKMGITIREVAATTKFSAKEVAEGMRTLGQAGFSASEAIETMQAVSDLATGTLSDITLAVDLVSTAMRVFQIDSVESTRVADVFANAVNKSKLTVDKLRVALNYVGPIAHNAGVSFEEMNAAMGALANSGLRASTIGTGLRRIFAELVSPGEKFAAAIQEAGFSFDDLDPRVNSLQTVLDNLSTIVTDSSEAFQLFGKRGAAAALALTGSDSQYSNLLATVSRSGTAAEQAATQMEGLGVMFKNLADRVGVLAIAIGNAGVTDFLKSLIVLARGAVTALTSLVNSGLGRFIIQLGLMVGSLTLAVGVFGKLLRILPLVEVHMVGVSAATGALSASSSGLTVAVTGLLGGLRSLATALGPVGIAIAVIGTAASITFGKMKDLKESITEFSNEADKYGRAAEKVDKYKLSVLDLDEGSAQLEEANKGLRKELLQVANTLSDVSEEALDAANSIDPLTGAIDTQSDALDKYYSKLQKVQRIKAGSAVQAAGENLISQTSDLASVGSFFKSYGSMFVELGQGAGESFATAANGVIKTLMFQNGAEEFKKIPAIFAEAWRNTSDIEDAFNEAYDISQLVNDGKLTFDELKDHIAKLDFSDTISPQTQHLKDQFDLLSQTAQQFINTYAETGLLDFTSSISSVRQFGVESGLTGIQLEAVLSKFKEFQEAAINTSSTGQAFRFAEDIDEETGKSTRSFDKMLDTYESVMGEMSDSSKASALKIEEMREEIGRTSIEIEKTKRAQIAAGVSIYDAVKKEQAARVELNKKIKEYNHLRLSEGTHIDVEKTLAAIKQRDEAIERANEEFKNNEEARAKAHIKIEEDYANKLAQIRVKAYDPKIIKANFNSRLSALKTSLKKELATIEQQEAKGVVSQNTANKKKAKLNKDYYTGMYAVAQEYFKKIGTLQTEGDTEYDAIQKKLYDLQAKSAEALADLNNSMFEAELEALEQHYDDRLDIIEHGKDEEIAIIALKEAEGILSTEQAREEELKAQIRFYRRSLALRKAYLSDLQERDIAQDSDTYIDAAKEVSDAELKLLQFRSKNILKFTKDYKKAQDEIEDTQEDIVSETKKHKDKLTELTEKSNKKIAEKEESLTQDLLNIARKRNEKLADLEETRVDSIKKAESDINKILTDAEDDLTAIRQKDMDDIQKEADNYGIMVERLDKARRTIRQAIADGDKYLLEEGVDLAESAKSIATGLDDESSAIQGVTKATDLLVKARKGELEIKKQAIEDDRQKEIYEAKRLSAEKKKETAGEIADIKNKTEQQITKENERHENEMKNLRKELAEWEKKLAAAEKLRQISSEGISISPTTQQTVEQKTTVSIVNETDPVDTASGYEQSRNRIQTATQDIINDNNRIVASTKDMASKVSGIELEPPAYRKEGDKYTNVIAESGTAAINAIEEQSNTAMGSVADGAKKMSTTTGSAITNVKASIESYTNELGNKVAVIRDSVTGSVQGMIKTISTPKTVDIKVEDNTREIIDRIKELRTEYRNIPTRDGSALIFPVGAEKQIESITEKVSNIFSGIEETTPQQKLQDMVTIFDSLARSGKLSFTELGNMMNTIAQYADRIQGIEVVFDADGNQATQVLDEFGKEYKGLHKDIQNNPMELGFDAEKIFLYLEKIPGILELIQRQAQENVELEVDVDGGESIEKVRDDVESVSEVSGEEITLNTDVDDALDNMGELISSAEEFLDFDNTEVTMTLIQKVKQEGSIVGAVAAKTGGLIQNLIPHFKDGGSTDFKRLLNPFISSGSGSKDDVPAKLMRGEYVQPVAAVRKYGLKFMELIRKGKLPVDMINQLVSNFNLGGLVKSISDPIGSSLGMNTEVPNLSSPTAASSAVAIGTTDRSSTTLSFVFEDGYQTSPVKIPSVDVDVMIENFGKRVRFKS